MATPLEISEWLDAEPLIDNRPVYHVPIKEYVVYSKDGKLVTLSKEGEKKEEQILSPPLDHMVKRNHSEDKTTIVFTGTRVGAENIAKSLAKSFKPNPILEQKSKEFFSGLRHKTSQAKDICDLIGFGIAYHHAGLQKCIRRFIEELLCDNLLKTIVATTTLSHGIDYKIDSVIIDISSMLMVKEKLPIFEYINLKGRTGRPRKSNTAEVYILCEITKPEKIFERYFHSSPEPITPTSTFSDENVASIILYEAYPELNLTKFSQFATKTFHHVSEQKLMFTIKNTITKLLKAKFFKMDGDRILVTELGLRVNQSSLTPDDAMLVLILKDNDDAKSILKIATQIDIVKKLRLNSLLSLPYLDILTAWMKGLSIDEIREKFGSFHDQDLIEFVSYTSSALRKMGVLIKNKSLKNRISRLQKRLDSRL